MKVFRNGYLHNNRLLRSRFFRSKTCSQSEKWMSLLRPFPHASLLWTTLPGLEGRFALPDQLLASPSCDRDYSAWPLGRSKTCRGFLHNYVPIINSVLLKPSSLSQLNTEKVGKVNMGNKKCYVDRPWKEGTSKVVFQQCGLEPATAVISCDILGSCLFTHKTVPMTSAFCQALELREYTASGFDDRACGWTQQLIQNIQTLRACGRTWESRRSTLQEHNIGFLSSPGCWSPGCFVLIQMLRWAVKWANRDRWDHYLYASLWNVISDMLDDYTAVVTRSHTQVTSHLPPPQCPFLPYILN